MIKILRTDSKNRDFLTLIQALDENLAVKNGNKNSFFQQYNQVDYIKNVVVIYKDEIAVACGAFKIFNTNTVEIKRMFTRPENRKQGLAQSILNELLQWAKEDKFDYAVLETGKQMKEAIRLYESFGFETIPNYPPYEKEETSVCFKICIN